MAMVVGITNYEEKNVQLSKDMGDLQCSFMFGMLAGACGVAHIIPDDDKSSAPARYGVTVDEALRRFNLFNTHVTMVVKATDGTPYVFEREFFAELARAKWGCNVSHYTDEQFAHEMQRRVLSKVEENLRQAGYHGYRRLARLDMQELDRVTTLAARMYWRELRGEEDYRVEYAEELFHYFEEDFMRMCPDGLVHHDEDGSSYLVDDWQEGWMVSDTPQEDE